MLRATQENIVDRLVWGVVPLLVAIACLLLAGPASAISIQRPDFVGKIRGYPDSEVRIKVRERHHKARSVRVEIRRIDLLCEDGTTRLVKIGPDKARVGPGSEFRSDFFFLADYGQIHFDVGGTLRKKNVTGYVYYVDDVFDPAPGLSDCSTRTFLNWRAGRV